MNVSVKQICKTFWELEAAHQLLQWRVEGVPLWPLIRMRLYYALVQQAGVFGAPHPARPKRLHAMAELLRPSGKLKLADNWVMPHERRVQGDDPYTAQLRNELGEQALVLDTAVSPMPGSYTICGALRRASLYAKLKAQHFRFSQADAQTLCTVEQALYETFNMTLDVAAMARKALCTYRAYLRVYRKLMQEHPPKRVYVVVAYEHPELIAAAREVGAEVIELQHGTISRYHLGYSYPSGETHPLMPDQLWCFGEYWPQTTPLPSDVKIKVIGAPFVRDLSRQHVAEKELGSVLFCSQGVIAKPLFAMAQEVALQQPDRTFYYNLHPSESLADYPSESLPSNLSLIHKTPTIYELMARCEIQVGVFSTTLFEGIVLGTKLILVNLPGIEYMQPLLAKEAIPVVNSASELVSQLGSAHLPHDASHYYAPPVDSILEQL